MLISSPPLVGRERELAILKSHVDSALRGKGGLTFLKGEAGVGKTRLLNELRLYCESARTLFLRGECYSPRIPYSPWTDVLNQFTRESNPETLRTLCRGPAVQIVALVPTLGSVIGAQEREFGLREWLRGPKPRFDERPVSALATSVEDESGRLAFFEGITQFFINVSKAKPLILSLEDLHRADKVTLELLRYVMRHVFQNRLLIIGSFREEELDQQHPLRQLLLELEKEALSQILLVEPLPREVIPAILAKTIGDTSIQPQLVDSLYAATRGNPYFIAEILRSMADRGLLKEGSLDPFKLRDLELPTSAKALIRQRVERLDAECLELIIVCSVIGPEFDHEVLPDVVGMPEEKILKHLETGLKAGLLTEKKTGSGYKFAFTDPRMYRILLDDLSAVRRRKLHEKIARCMEKVYSRSLPELAGEIAYHYGEAGNVERTTHYSTMAAEKAASIHAYHEAIRHYRKVTELAGSLPVGKDAESKVRVLEGSLQSWNRALETAADMLWIDEYNKIAEMYENHIVPLFENLARTVVQTAHLRTGQRVLDIGTGTGLAAFTAAEAVGPNGSILGIDLSDGMLSLALKKSQDLGSRNVEFKKMDETSMDLPSNSFDAVISNLGLTVFNPDRAFEEIFRVLRHGGNVTFNEWAERQESTAGRVFEATVKQYITRNPSELLVAFREAASYTERGFSRLSNPVTLRKMLEQAGLSEISVTPLQHKVVLPTVDDYLKMTQSWWSTSLEVADMSPENREKFLAEVTQKLTSLLSKEGIVLDWELNYFTANK